MGTVSDPKEPLKLTKMFCNKTKTVAVEDYSPINEQLFAIRNQLRLMCSVHSTAHFKERDSIMTCLNQLRY